MRLKPSTASVLAALTMLLNAGCESSRSSLDRFSLAYTGFRDAATFADQGARMTIDENSVYWKALTEAMNMDVVDAYRASASERALDAYRVEIVPVCAVFGASVDAMDSTVTDLIKAANRIQLRAARDKAVEVADHARAMQLAYASIRHLDEQRFRLQLAVLQDMVREGGSTDAILASRARAEELKSLIRDSNQRWEAAVEHWNRANDTFAAMQGAFNLKPHASKSDSAATAYSGEPPSSE